MSLQLYPYAFGQISAMENRLLSKSTLLKLVSSASEEEVMQAMVQAGYSAASSSYKEVLAKARQNTYHLAEQWLGDPSMMDVFKVQNDYHNLKILLKNALTGKKEEAGFLFPVTVSHETMKKASGAEIMPALPPIMASAITNALSQTSGEEIDVILDKATFLHQKEAAEKTKSAFLEGFVRLCADAANIKIFLRYQKKNETKERFQKALVPGGTASEDLWLAHREGKSDAFLHTECGKLYAKTEGKSGEETERILDDAKMAYMKKAKMMPLTEAVIYAYVYAKETEIQALSMIIMSVSHGLSPSVIEERLRETYV